MLIVPAKVQPSMRLVPAAKPTSPDVWYWLLVMVPATVRFLMVALLMYEKRAVPRLSLSVMMAVMVWPSPRKVPLKAFVGVEPATTPHFFSTVMSIVSVTTAPLKLLPFSTCAQNASQSSALPMV